MARTTPERPVDVEGLFPELARYRRTATRLHPRPGVPGVRDSSVGGPMLWPADEPWPVCTHPHKRSSGERVENVRLKRRIRAEAWRRTPEPGVGPGLTDAEREVLASLKRGRHAPWLANTDPIPLLAVAQLYRKDVPDLFGGPVDCDVLQVFWCPFNAHGTGHQLALDLRWRRSADVREVLAEQPEPVVVGAPGYVLDPCVLHPEQVVEHQYIDLLPDRLRRRIEKWEVPEDEREPDDVGYRSDLSIAPGWKVGGFASWHVTDPAPMDCECGQPMEPLLTIASYECDSFSSSWVPVEDRATLEGAIGATSVLVSRDGILYVFVCPRNPGHPHRLSLQ
ncbi:hypothetical protein [Kitasatospora purpeofusca]|uniref:hypothetical protein n=1 Tax=Kitasatospora purpeofusca TaxID=67352 RepID=UPI0004C26B98|nr:hypothetical protein [Kitasatospora purpeofusca]